MEHNLGLEAPAEQRSVSWFDERKGKFTSSEVFKLLTDPTKKEQDKGEVLSKGAKTYIRTKIAEEIGGSVPFFDNDATAWGTMQEPQAREAYEIRTGIIVEDASFMTMDGKPYYGGSPDGLIIDFAGNIEGVIEIKCPYNTANHIEHCLIESTAHFKENFTEKYWQCVSNMAVTGAKYCDFISYDPRVKEIGLFAVRIERDEKEIAFLLKKIEQAQEYRIKLKTDLGL